MPDLTVLLAAALVFIPLERLLPLHRGQAVLRAGWTTDVLHMFVSGLLIRVGALAATVAIATAALSLVPDGVRTAIRSQPDWLEFVELLVLSDLGFYVAHRTVHAVPWLWRFHAVHHSSEQLDWLATFRVHPVDQIFNSAVIALPGLVLGFSAGPMVAYALFYRWHSLLLHSNAAIGFGRLGKWMASPHFHHWHHADEVQAHDRNFGGQLVIWDRLFGTLYANPGLPSRYGVDGAMPEAFVDQLAEPFRPGHRKQETAASGVAV